MIAYILTKVVKLHNFTVNIKICYKDKIIRMFTNMRFQVTAIKELSIYTEFYFIYFIISDNIKFVNDK